MQKQVWIGLVHVTPGTKQSSFLKKAKGAFVQALAFVDGGSAFKAEVKMACEKMGIVFRSAKEMEPLAERRKSYQVSKNIIRLSKAVADDGQVEFDTFHSY